MAGDEIVMPDNALLMVHEPYGAAIGTAADMRAMAAGSTARMTRLLLPTAAPASPTLGSRRCSPPRHGWTQEAVDLGFADRVADPVKIAASFDLTKFNYRHPPQPSPAAAWSRVISARFSKAAG